LISKESIMAKSKSYDPLAALRVVSDTSAPSSEETPAPVTDQSAAAPQSSLQLVETDQGLGRTATKPSIVAPLKPAPATGKETSRPSFYFYPEDVSKMRSLIAYVAGQHGIRINDSLIIRALLHLSQPGQPLIEAIENVKQMDRRRSAKRALSETHTI
jgi:hypothetical protein